MNTVPLKLVTIVCDPALESRLLQDIKRLGARGERIIQARGEGAWEVQPSDMPHLYFKIETVVSPEVADAILSHVADRYFPYYSILAYASTVEVVRVEKFVQALHRKTV